jgi:glycosidase
MNFLGTHDTERILTVLGVGSVDMTMQEKAVFKMNCEQRVAALILVRLAYTILAFMPGIPCIFYGDEAGVEGLGDPFNRSTYPWGREDKELLFFYRELGRIRRSKRILRGGYLRVIEDTPRGIFAFERFDLKGNLLRVVVNRSESTYDTGMKGENLISHLFGCEKSSSVIPPLSAGLWQIKAAKIEIPK